MNGLMVLNDLHIGCIRSGGTTPATALKLRRYLLEEYQSLLERAKGCDLLINGDLFDTPNIPLTDLLQTIRATLGWLETGTGFLILPPGNHDLSKNSETYSSFEFFANILQEQYPTRVQVPKELCAMWGRTNSYIIPHVPNQDLFDMELAKVPSCEYLFLHCNYANGFAAKSDHSLNLSEERAALLPVQHIVIGHEHQAKTALNAKVIIVGNQIPSSVSDCLGNDEKFALLITTGILHQLQTWTAAGSFARVDWRTLDQPQDGIDFIRVEGEAFAAEASQVVSAIAKYRQKSEALVITNAVNIEGSSTTEMTVSLEQIKSFSVLEELLKILSAEEQTVVLQLLEKENV